MLAVALRGVNEIAEAWKDGWRKIAI